MVSFISKIDIKRYKYLWISLSVFFAFIWLWIAKLIHNPLGDEWYIIGVDAKRDILAIENLFSRGIYDFGEHNLTFRMPGWGIVYGLFRLFFDTHLALTFLTIFQTTLSGLSAYTLSIIAFNYSNKKPLIFILTLLGYLSFSYVFQHNFGFNKEGLAISAIIFSTYYISEWKENGSNQIKILLLAGLFLTWASFLRPYILAPYLFYAIIIYFDVNDNKIFGFRLKPSLFFVLPIIVFISIWTLRNYANTNRIIFLETSNSYMSKKNNYYIIQHNFYTSWGGDAIPWMDNQEGSWLAPKELIEDVGKRRAGDDVFPEYIFNDHLTIDTLKRARALYWEAFDYQKGMLVYPKKLEESSRILTAFATSVKEDHSFNFYVKSKFILLYKFLNQKQGLQTRSLKYPLNVGFAFTEAFLARGFFFIGLLATIVMIALNFKDSILIKMIAVNVGFVALFFPFYYGLIEYRYISTAVPFFLLSLIFALTSIQMKNLKAFYIVLSSIIVILTISGILAVQSEITW